MKLFGFSEASKRIYAAAVDIRYETAEGMMVRLAAAKTKVAPTKSMAVLRLELCGAVLLMRLVRFTRTELSLSDVPACLITDSTLIGIIRAHLSRWTTFMANRVVEIQTPEPHTPWQHVPSEDNRLCIEKHIRCSRSAAHSVVDGSAMDHLWAFLFRSIYRTRQSQAGLVEFDSCAPRSAESFTWLLPRGR